MLMWAPRLEYKNRKRYMQKQHTLEPAVGAENWLWDITCKTCDWLNQPGFFQSRRLDSCRTHRHQLDPSPYKSNRSMSKSWLSLLITSAPLHYKTTYGVECWSLFTLHSTPEFVSYEGAIQPDTDVQHLREKRLTHNVSGSQWWWSDPGSWKVEGWVFLSYCTRGSMSRCQAGQQNGQDRCPATWLLEFSVIVMTESGELYQSS